VGATFRAAREWLGLSQQQVADLTAERGLPVSRSALCDVERGCNLPSVESLVSLCEILQVDPHEILERVIHAETIGADLARCSLDELRRRGRVLFWNAQYRAADVVYAAIAERLELDTSLEPSERRHLRASAQITRAQSLRRFGSLRAAHAAAARALHLASAGDDDLAVEALVFLAKLHTDNGVMPLTEAAIEQALRLAKANGSPRLLRLASNGKACALFDRSRLEDAAELFRVARDLSIQTGSERSQSRNEGSLGTCLAHLGHPSAARRQFERALRLARRSGDRFCEVSLHLEIGRVAFQMEDLDEAETRALASLSAGRVSDVPVTAFSAIWLRHRIARRCNSGNPDRQRVEYLKRLYPRVANFRGEEAVREFRREVLGVQDA